eukprot:scaffold22713_cov139-Cylindrotheca_fusiformis.AAC.5
MQMTQSFSDKASEMAESLKTRMSDTFAPLKDRMGLERTVDPKVSEIFTSCYQPMEDDFDENSYQPGVNDTFAEMDQEFRKIVSKTIRRKFKCNGEDDTDTIYTEAFNDDNGSSYFDEYTTSSKTADLNTVDDRNYPGGKVSGQSKNVDSSEEATPAHKQSFKDKYAQMKAKQQFANNPNKVVAPLDTTGAAKQCEAAKLEKQRRAEYSRKLAQKRSGTVPMDPRSPKAPPTVPRMAIDP